ncbi:isoleucine--tRNA ligase [Mycoplasmopsis lipophila]|uniref:isoleucine--tRNA ligase n=1 Tax=Mycoplasmopsis lipophila TaxID=2117 RepID=UPI003872DB8E
MNNEIDLKKTLIMPKTNFDMRANLVTKEPLIFQRWNEQKIYELVLEKNKNNTPFILHDGPPYANGDIHVGHAMNKILKDIIIRYKSLRGFYTPFVPGWDTHGLPIEHKMLLESKIKSKDELSTSELRKKAAEYALSQVEKQKQEFQKFNLLCDFKKFYITMDKKFEAQQLRLFKKMVFDGLVYKGLKPVYWSPSSQSALAEAEVEYQDIKSPSIFVAFKVEELNKNKQFQREDNLIIWTTTPWTLLANAGVAVGEKITYVRFEYQQKFYIVAKELFTKVIDTLEFKEAKIISEFKSREMIGLKYLSPLNKNLCPVVYGHHVNLESGSGLVHIAPLFGEDDFQIGIKENLNMIMHIEDNGTINEKGLQYQGQFYEKANELIIKELEEKHQLLNNGTILHSYPHDWRTHKPILFRGTPQWFVSIDKIKHQIIDELDKVNASQEWSKKRLSNMIIDRHDWTISRQRKWGVPIIIFYDRDKKPVLKEDLFEHIISLVEKYGSDIWFDSSAEELLPEKYKNQGFTKENNIMDVWFDSGTTFLGVDIDSRYSAPYDLYLEGSDQYRGWFNSSLINSVAFSGRAPYKNLLSHGFVLDGKGEKMSKSKGNTVDPLKMVQKYGADILRLWVANSEYSNDVSISEQIMNQNAEIYRKIRNTIKFLLGNLNNYKYNPQTVRKGVHSYIKEKLIETKLKVIKAYDEYKLINVVKHLNNFIVELSSFYLSITKDILYIEEFNSENRMMTLANFYEITDFLIKAIAPILPATAEDAYDNFESKVDKQISVHLERLEQNNTFDEKILKQWDEFFVLRDEVNVIIENAIKNNLIKRSNEAKVVIKTKSDFIKSLDLKFLLMVGKVEFGLKNSIDIFESEKCLRCWNHFPKSKIVDNLCPLCYSIVNKKD